ncbi:MAG: hypothetical protein KY459_13435 [Acidobacteria bacterium]|nr:hypothetical protein [Acidobacteriota bacterium]
MKGAYLVPDGWHFKSSTKGDTLGYFASRENIDSEGAFLVGMTVNVKRHLKGKSVKKAIQEIIRGYARSGTILKFSDASQDPFVGSVLQLDDGITTMHILLVGNPETNTLYIFMFEAPTREWPKMWHDFGEVMFNQLLIDDGI